MTIKEKLSNTIPARVLRELKRRREQDIGDIAADVVNSQAVRVTVQKRVNQVLHIQRMVSEGVGKALGAVNISSRDDVMRVATQLASIEDVIAQLQVDVRQLRVALAERKGGTGAQPDSPVRPAIKRTRQPTAAKV